MRIVADHGDIGRLKLHRRAKGKRHARPRLWPVTTVIASNKINKRREAEPLHRFKCGGFHIIRRNADEVAAFAKRCEKRDEISHRNGACWPFFRKMRVERRYQRVTLET